MESPKFGLLQVAAKRLAWGDRFERKGHWRRIEKGAEANINISL
jgi:hypothetical protein